MKEIKTRFQDTNKKERLEIYKKLLEQLLKGAK